MKTLDAAQRPPYPKSLLDPVFSPLLLQLHRAVEFETLWQAGNQLLHAAMPQFHCLAALPCFGEVPLFIRTTLPIRDIPNYWSQFREASPPISQMIRDHPGATIKFLSDDFPWKTLRKTRFYRDFMAPDGWRYGAGFLIWSGSRFLGQFSIIRTPVQGDYNPDERALLLELQPHFEAAVQRVALLDHERAARRALQSGLAHSAEGRVVLDWNLEPIFYNHAAVEACSTWSTGIDVSPLSAATLRHHFVIPLSLQEAARELLEGFKRSVTKDELSGGTLRSEIAHPGIPGLKVGLQILEPKSPRAIEPSLLMEFSRILPTREHAPIYSLTPSERRVAEHAAAGRSNDEIAQKLHLSINTVRSHLREVFAKLGVVRRSQLAGILQ